MWGESNNTILNTNAGIGRQIKILLLMKLMWLRSVWITQVAHSIKSVTILLPNQMIANPFKLNYWSINCKCAVNYLCLFNSNTLLKPNINSGSGMNITILTFN